MTGNITTNLRPDYYEWFPNFTSHELEARLHYLPFSVATLLMPTNIKKALALHPQYRDVFKQFLNLEPIMQRIELVATLKHAGISQATADAMGRVRREEFAPPEMRRYSYLNTYLPWNRISCLSTPGIVALMIDQLIPVSGMIVEIGLGSGYHAACLLETNHQDIRIIGAERNESFLKFGRDNLDRAGYSRIHAYRADSSAMKRCLETGIDVVYCTAAGLGAAQKEFSSAIKTGGKFQYVRPLSKDEFEGEPESSWLKQTYETYSNYEATEWRRYGVISMNTCTDHSLSEATRIYDVEFVPIYEGMGGEQSSHRRDWLLSMTRLAGQARE